MDSQIVDIERLRDVVRDPASGADELVNALNELDNISMTVQTLKSTKIGIIVNKLTKKTDIPSSVINLAATLVHKWRQLATEQLQSDQQRPIKRKRHWLEEPQSLDNEDDDDDAKQSNNNKNDSMDAPPSKRQRFDNNNNANMLLGFSPQKKRGVSSLQDICIKVMKQNAMQLGKIPCELNATLVSQIYGSCRPSELKQVYKQNPQLRRKLDPLWKRHLHKLSPNYVKEDDTISWFKAHHLFLRERKDRIANVQQKLQSKMIMNNSDSKLGGTRTLSRDEAMVLKRKMKSGRRGVFLSKNQKKKNRMIQDCRNFVDRRHKLFNVARRKQNIRKNPDAHRMNRSSSLTKKDAFVRRQKQLRDKRTKEKHQMCNW